MTKFAEQLLDDLMREHGAALEDAGLPATADGRAHALPRPALLAGGAGTLAVGLTVGLTVFGGGASPAYAVIRHPDGTLTVAVSQPSGVTGANQRLQTLGARVVVVPVQAGCPLIGSLPAPKVAVPGPPRGKQAAAGKVFMSGASGGKVTSGGKDGSGQPAGATGSAAISGKNKDGSVSVQAQHIPAGDLVVLAVGGTGDTTQMFIQLTSGPAPSCVSLPPHAPGGTVHTGPAPVPAS